MKSEFEIAIAQLSSDRNLPQEVIIGAIEGALVSAYKRNYGANQNVSVNVDPRTGQARVFVKKLVADTVTDARAEIPLAEARLYEPGAQVGDFVDIEIKPRNFGRIAAQTAKQVIMQKIREAERDSVFQEYSEREGELANAVVRNVEARTGVVTVNIGKAEAVLPKNEQIPGEHYRFNQRLRVYISEVERTGHGPQITVSRAHRGLLRRLLELEVPEIYNGTVEIKSIAREPGSRSKVAVAALQPGVDPVGSCVGMRGVRIQNIVNELNGEKIDVVAWSPEMETFIANALSPAKVITVHLNEADKTAKVVVPDKSLSLAIGKEGQNARLAAKLTGWRIDIRSETEAAEEARQMAVEAEEAAVRAEELETARREAAALLAEAQASLEEDEEELELLPEEEALALQPEGAHAEEVEPSAQPQTLEELPTEDVEPEVVAAPEPAEAMDMPPSIAVGETVQEPEKVIVAQDEEGTVATEQEELVELADEEDGEDDEDDDSKRKSRKKKRGRQLEYDERLGRVVAHKKRKPSRSKGWLADDDEWTG